jgi:hypothetical protein
MATVARLLPLPSGDWQGWLFCWDSPTRRIVLLALAASGVNPWVMMTVYATAVTCALVAVTFLAVKAFEWSRGFTKRIEPMLPKLTAVVLALMAILIVWG